MIDLRIARKYVLISKLKTNIRRFFLQRFEFDCVYFPDYVFVFVVCLPKVVIRDFVHKV